MSGETGAKLDVAAAIAALERGDETISSIARAYAWPEADVVRDIASHYWWWGESDRALPLLEEELGRASSVVLQMAYLRCLISLAGEHRAAVKNAVTDLHALLRRRFSGPATLDLSAVDPRSDRKLRLGFLCTYSNLKPVELSLVPMFRALDRSRFHTSFFSLDQAGNPLLDQVCDEHVVLRGCSAQAVCDTIRGRKIDLLFDLNGILREDFPIEVFGMRAAPVQAGWWNTPISSGLDTVQYFFTDRRTLGPEADDLFTETIVEIPGGAPLCYELSDRHQVAPPPCLHSDSFVFGSFTALFKINDVVLDGWAQILARAPHTRLFIKAMNSTSARFRARLARVMAKHRIGWERIFCEEDHPFDEMMNRYAAVDLCLNTYNYGTGTTALNAVWQGIPTLTFRGRYYANGTAAMMVDCGLDDFVVRDRDAYIEQAIRLSCYPKRLLDVRPLLRDHVRAYSNGLSAPRFARNFEQACTNAWADWCTKQRSSELVRRHAG